MITSRDINEAANLLIKQFGNDASAFVMRSVDHLALKGDRNGEALWLRLGRAVKSIETATSNAHIPARSPSASEELTSHSGDR